MSGPEQVWLRLDAVASSIDPRGGAAPAVSSDWRFWTAADSDGAGLPLGSYQVAMRGGRVEAHGDTARFIRQDSYQVLPETAAPLLGFLAARTAALGPIAVAALAGVGTPTLPMGLGLSFRLNRSGSGSFGSLSLMLPRRRRRDWVEVSWRSGEPALARWTRRWGAPERSRFRTAAAYAAASARWEAEFGEDLLVPLAAALGPVLAALCADLAALAPIARPIPALRP